MEIFIVLVAVGLSAAYVGRTFYKKFSTAKRAACDCGCSTCSMDPACSAPPTLKSNDPGD